MSSTIRRAKKDADNPYKAIRRATFEDERLSWEARGLLGYLLVKPDDWKINVANLVNRAPGGRDRVYRILNELIEHHYIQRTEIRVNGKIAGYEYIVFEEPYTEEPEQMRLLTVEPDTEKPDTESPLPEKPDTVLPDTANTDISKEERDTKEEKKLIPPTAAQPTATPDPVTSETPVSGGEKKTTSAVKEILSAYAELKEGAINWGKEGAWAKRIDKAGGTPAEVVGCYQWLKADSFWEFKPISLAVVHENLPEYRRYLERKGSPKSAGPKVVRIFNQYTGKHEERRLS